MSEVPLYGLGFRVVEESEVPGRAIDSHKRPPLWELP